MLNTARFVDVRLERAADRQRHEPGLALCIPTAHEPVVDCGIGDLVSTRGEQSARHLVLLGYPDQRIRRLRIPFRRQVCRIKNVEEDASAQHAHEDRDRADRAAHRRLGHRQIETSFLGDVGERGADRAIGAIDGREVTFAEQQRDAVLHHDAAQRIAHTGPAVAQRDIFAARATLFVELVRQDVVQPAVQHALQNIQCPCARRIVRIARDQGADRLEHGTTELCVVCG